MRWAAALAAALAILLTGAGAAAAQELRRPSSLTERLPTRARTGAEVARIAAGVPKIRAEVRRHRGVTREVYLKGGTQWQVSWYDRGGKDGARREIAQVTVDDHSGAVLEAWTGFRVAWTMARGYDGAFGRVVNAPYVWIPMLLAFTLPFVDPRRPLRWLHLDLLVLAGFSGSYAFFNAGEIETSVPLVSPLLAYLLVRMLAIALRRRAPDGPWRPPPLLVPVSWLAIGLVFLVGFRVGLNITSSNVIDVGYAGVIGADKLADGEPLYGTFPKDNQHGDTYGPLAYLAYVPFEQLLPWDGRWGDLPAARAAALVFDLLTLAAIMLLGRRLGGSPLAVTLGYAWAAFPFSLFALMTNANDALVSLLLVVSLLAAASPPARGLVLGAAAMVKFAPAVLAPALATHGLRDRPWRERLAAILLFGGAFVVVIAVGLEIGVDDLGTFYERTIGFQQGREAPFSIWGLYGLDLPQKAVQIGAVLLAVAVAVVPRRADLAGLAAVCAAVLVALQLGVTYWFYLYIVWFFPLVMLALLAPRPSSQRSTP